MSEPLIHGFDFKLAAPECHPGSVEYRALIDLKDNISQALPYMNAELGGLDYHQHDGILIWTDNGKMYAFRPHEITIAPVVNAVEARELAENIIDRINQIWERRAEIKPNFEGRKSLPNVLDIYKLLPKTNCRECGYLTCMGFATMLRKDSTKRSLCCYLSEQDYAKVLLSP